MQYPTERELIEMLKTGQENAFILLYNRYQPIMFKMALKKFPCKQDAEDIIQEIFSSFWNRRSSLSTDMPVKYYLLRAVQLQYAYFCRHKAVEKKYLANLKEVSPTYYSFENKELGDHIKKAIQKIKAPACRKIFEMAYLENQQCTEISIKMKIKPQVVRNQTSRALKVVREELKKVV